MDKEETKLVYTYDDDGKYTGTKTLDYTDRSPISGAWQIPAGCTEMEPPNDKDGFDIIWNGTSWMYQEKEAEPEEPAPTEPTAAERKAQAADKITEKYAPQRQELKDSLVIAMLTEDVSLQAEIKEEYAAVVAAEYKEMEALNNETV